MDEFQRKYSTFYCVSCITGLWPFNHSILAKVQRTIIPIIILCCVIIQFSSLITSELTFNNILVTLSAGCPMLVWVTRYVGYIYSFPSVRFAYENIYTDFNALKNPVEVNILMSNIDASRRVFLIYLVVCCLGIFFIIMGSCFPSILNLMVAENKTQPHYLKAIGFFVEDRYVTVITVHVAVTFTIGLLVLSCTEGSLAVFAYYVCGLFKIVSYRIQNVIDNATQEIITTKSNVSDISGIREAVAMHRRSINLIDVQVNGAKLTYLVAIILSVISFGINLYRYFLAIMDMHDYPPEVVVSSMFLIILLAIIFLDNHNGQKIMDDSVSVFYDTYNTLWYCMPLGMQKLLLMIMLRSSIVCTCNLSGLFVPCYQGFSTVIYFALPSLMYLRKGWATGCPRVTVAVNMMSTSFSYFTLLYSVQ